MHRSWIACGDLAGSLDQTLAPFKSSTREAELLARTTLANVGTDFAYRLFHGGKSSPSALSPAHARKSA